MKESEKERLKLTANLLNALASGVIITGIVAPAVAVLFGIQAAAGVSAWLFVVLSFIWLFLAIALHLLARRLLGSLKP